MHLRFRLSILAIVGGLVSVGVPASRADELRLANGDRITGTEISRADGKLVFASDLLGQITVPLDQIKEIVPPHEPPPPVAPPTPLPKAELAQAEAARAKTSAPTPPPEAKPHGLRAELKAWKGKLELGYRQQDGKTNSTNFDFRASAERKIGANDLKATARLLYGEQNDAVNNERYDGSFRWRRDLGDRTFAQSLTSYYRDPLKKIPNNWEQNVGAGYSLFKNEEHVINIGAGLTGQFRETEVDPEGSFYALIEVFQDYSYQISKRVKFSQNAVAQYSPDGQGRFVTVNNQPSVVDDGSSNYKLRFDTTLQGQLTNSISLNLRYEYEFDNAVVTKAARADQRITSSIGYGF